MEKSFIIDIIVALVTVVTTIYASNPVIEFTMVEEVSSGYPVGSIANKSVEFLGTNTTDLVYNLMTQKSTEAQTLFSINDQTGDLFTIVKIDREHVCKEYDTTCKVSFDVGVSSKDRQFFQIVSVNVFIEDINDNAPLFAMDMYFLNVSEGTHIGYTHIIQQAVDKDTGANNSVQSYELVTDEQFKGYFTLNVTKSLDQRFSVKLILAKLLDRELVDFFSVRVIAKDGGSPQMSGTITINVNVLDTNDNTPEFTQNFYNKTVKDNTVAMETILTLSAVDKDLGDNGRVSYRLSEFQKDKDILDQLFLIVSETGELKVKSDLTSVAGNSYQFYVEAFDHGQEPLWSQAQVEIHIEDYGNNAPVVSISFLTPGNMGFVNISENDKNSTFVAHVNVEDPDTGLNGEVDCSISNTHFAMVKIDKGYKVVVNAVLDREVLNSYNLTVTCTDKGTPVMSTATSFAVRITDYNDNKPVFGKQTYTAKLKENNVGNEMFAQVSAADADEGINAMFNFQPHEDVKGRFIIDPNTGIIKANSVFDREVEPTVTFRVLAVDDGSPKLTGTATVVLTITDENDNDPKFTKSVYGFTVLENQQTGASVDTLEATDLDEGVNAEFDFSISPDYVSTVPFDVISHTGVIMTTKQLNREERSRYDFVVVVTDRGDRTLSSLAHVTVTVADVNDNAPIVTFPRPSNNSVAVPYPDYETNYITTVEAYDLDEGINKELEFSIKSGNDLDIFEIDAVSGVLSFKKQIDTEESKFIALEVSVKDKGNPPLEVVKTLYVELQYTNATFLKSTEEPINSKYIIISVVVVMVTLVISGAIIGVILFLRTVDLKKKQKAGDSSSTNTESDFGFSPANQSHTILTSDTLSSGSGEGHDLIKKKEVSFVLDTSDSYDYHQKQNLTTPPKDKPSKVSCKCHCLPFINLKHTELNTEFHRFILFLPGYYRMFRKQTGLISFVSCISIRKIFQAE